MALGVSQHCVLLSHNILSVKLAAFHSLPFKLLLCYMLKLWALQCQPASH